MDLQQEYRQSWQKFVNGEDVPSLPNPSILDSWRRCQHLNVSPWQKTVVAVLDAQTLAKIRNNNKLFMEVSMPALENLYQFVAGSGFTVALSDSNGYLLEVFGDESARDSALRGKWSPGACWSEMSAGNNLIGTAIHLDRPLSITGYEHYCLCSHKWAGAGAPIHDSDGNIIGVIALAGTIEKSHAHTLGMVVAAANAIEIQLAMKKAWHDCELANQHKNIIVNSIYEGLLVTDERGLICLANRRAQEILRLREERLLGIHINTLLSESFIKSMQYKTSREIIDQEEEFTTGESKIKCTVTCRQILKNGMPNGLVIVFNEIARAKKLVNKLYSSDARLTFNDIIGRDPNFLATLEMAKTFSATESNILLLGESGTGKDVFAQAIHNASVRRNGPFIPINCGAIPKELIGSELFGYSEGAFTGARKGGHLGKFELADGGTLFLDEIGEMPAEQQMVLLRVLEEKKVTRIGGRESIPVDVRIIAATNVDMTKEVKKGTFRQDLFYRLNIFTIKMIPLRERKGDIELLTEAFLVRLADKMGRPPVEVPDDVWALLLNYDWPGNVRELQNVLERAFVLASKGSLSRDLFSFSQSTDQPDETPVSHPPENLGNIVRSGLQNYEANMIKNILQQNSWNISKTSIALGVSRTTLYRKIGIYGINLPRQ